MGVELTREMAGRRLYVGNIPFETDDGSECAEDHLRGYFAQYGRITDVILMRDRNSRRLRGFGFVEFSTASEAQAACSEIRQEFHGRMLVILIANPRRSNSQRSEDVAPSRADNR